MDFSNTLFRCSSLGAIMTDPRSKSETLSETCKAHLIDVFVREKYGREQDITTKYMEKGLRVEEDSITLYSRVNKRFFRKNEEHLSNTHIKGTPDLFTGEEIRKAETIIDIKSSWDIYTFYRVHTQGLNKMYYWQLQGYMALTNAKSAKLVYCLVNTPENMLLEEKRRLFYKMNVPTEENPDYIAACEALEQSMIFNDIPMSERVIELDVQRCDSDIDRINERVINCRKYLNELEQVITPSAASAIIAQYDQQSKTTVLQDINLIPLQKIN